jgi:hypothetical protein
MLELLSMYDYSSSYSDAESAVDSLSSIADSMSSMSGTMDRLVSVGQNLGGLVLFHTILAVILGIALVVFAYIIPCYVLMFQGRKAGLRTDWFAYVPIMHSIYRMDMVREDRWKIIFIGGVAKFIQCVLCFFLGFMAGAGVNVVLLIFFDILVLAYLAFCIVFNYLYDRKFFVLFGYSPELSLIGLASNLTCLGILVTCAGGFAGGIYFAGTAFGILAISKTYYAIVNFDTAFNNRVVTGNETDIESEKLRSVPGPGIISGKIACTAGMYKDAIFDIESNFEMVIGRDSFYSSIVITENADTISRKHCGIKYNAETREYTVTDYSSNGTYTNTGERLQRNVPRNFPAGTIICLGDKTNRFRLM